MSRNTLFVLVNKLNVRYFTGRNLQRKQGKALAFSPVLQNQKHRCFLIES